METNMERLDLNIRVLTELIQEQIQYYIYYETTNMEELRMGIRADVESAITAITVILVLILARGMDGQQEDCAGNHGAHPAAV